MFSAENRWLIILIVALAVVAVLIFALRRGFVDWMQGLPGGKKAGVVGRTYYNHLYGLSVSVPNEEWQIAYYGEADTLGQARLGLPLIANLRPLVEMRRRNQDSIVAFVQVGVLSLGQPHTPESLARQGLEEIRREASPDSANFKVLRDVTPTLRERVRGAYFVVRMPPEEKLPMRVVMFLVRNSLGYVLVSQVTKEDYDTLRSDIQRIMSSFRLVG